MDSRIEVVVAAIERDFCDCKLNCETLAGLVNLPPSRLHHLFKTETGEAPMTFINCRRMREAEVLLTTTFLSVKEVRYRVGFCNYGHFTHGFKRDHGVTPGKYRAIAGSKGRIVETSPAAPLSIAESDTK